MGHCHVERSSQSHGRHVTALIFLAVFMSFPVLATVKNVTTIRPDCIDGFPAVMCCGQLMPNIVLNIKNQIWSYRSVESSSELSKMCFVCIWAEHQLRCDTSLFEQIPSNVPSKLKKEEMEGSGIGKSNPRRCGGN